DGNLGTGDSLDIELSGDAPELTITTSDADLTAGETATITFTFTEAVSGFVDGDISVSGGTLGAISTSDGGVTYTATFTPDTANGNTSATIVVSGDSYTDSDNNTGSDANLSLVLVNSAPEAEADNALTEEDTALNNINVLSNDSDADDDMLSIQGIPTALNGTVTVNPDGTLNYVPDADFNGVDTITYIVADGQGGTDTGTVSVAVTAVNDVATITVNASDAAVTEDDAGDNTASGTVAVADVDNGEGTLASSTATYGTVTVDGSGNWTYALDNGNATVQALAAGETLTDTITFTSDDGTTQTQEITITGTNDAATISVTASDTAVTEDDAGNNTASGTVAVADVDNGEGTLASSTATYGTVTVDGSGNWTYTLDNNNQNVEALLEGETLIDTIVFTSDDGTSATQSVTITGSNAVPIVSDDTSTTSENTVLNDNVPVATDVDGVITGYSLASGVGAGNGNLVFNLDGSYT
ncbi:VCBS domain-containing protein, partial [Porticoccus sp. W117]|uniref:VCBS domain-containing protein n=1 Tax=Porticoccus sp. W117 TaxID=3054777 RepID=UPI00259A7C36